MPTDSRGEGRREMREEQELEEEEEAEEEWGCPCWQWQDIGAGVETVACSSYWH